MSAILPIRQESGESHTRESADLQARSGGSPRTHRKEPAQGTLLLEQNEWLVGHRYLSGESLGKLYAATTTPPPRVEAGWRSWCVEPRSCISSPPGVTFPILYT